MFYRIATAVFLLAPPVHAQDTPFCGGISVVGEWVGGSEAASDVSTATAAFDGDGSVPIAGHMVRIFTLSAPTEIRAEVEARPAGDPYISIFDVDGVEVAADDDSGGNFASRIEAGLGPGTYCLAARSYETGVTDVAIRIGRTDHAALTEGGAPMPPAQVDLPSGPGCFAVDTPSLGTDLTPETLEASATGTVAERPAYDFHLAEPTQLTIFATSDQGDPMIVLLDETGQELAQNDDFEGLNSRIDMTEPLPAGSYCIEVEDLNGAANDITVSLQGYDPAEIRARQLADAEVAPTPDDDVDIRDLGALDTALLANVDATGRAKWLRFDVPEGGLLLAEAVGNGADPALTLFDRVGRQVGYNDDGPTGLDSQMAVRLFPGSYLLAVRLITDGSAPIQVVLERFVPAP